MLGPQQSSSNFVESHSTRVSNMTTSTSIRTFVSSKIGFLDESKLKVTSIAFIAIHRFDLNNSQEIPRILDKLVVSFDGVKSGNEAMGRLFCSFLQRQESPICLLSHGGSKSEFPALKSKFIEMGYLLNEIGGYPLQYVDTESLLRNLPKFRLVQGPGEEQSSIKCMFHSIMGEEYKGSTLEDECLGLVRLLLKVKLDNELFLEHAQTFESISQRALLSPESYKPQSQEESDASDEKIASYAFWDLETTGVNRATDQITEICIIAAKREEVFPFSSDDLVKNDFSNILPQTYDKIRLAIDPQVQIPFGVTEMTGLSNRALNDSQKRPWDENTTLMIRDFIAKQTQPCCLIAYNGNSFDVKFLQRYISRYGNYKAEFSEFYRADPMTGVRQLTKHQKLSSYSLDSVINHFTGKTDVQERHTSGGDTKALIAIVRLCPGDMLEWIDQKKVPLMQQKVAKKLKKQPCSDNCEN